MSNIIYDDKTMLFIFTLFSKCNLNCDFCFQRFHRSDDIDIEAIKNIPKLLEEKYLNAVDPNIKDLDLGFLGGELFSDDISDSMFEVYRDLCNDIILLIRKYLPNAKIKIEWISNGVFTKHERVLKLLNSFGNEYRLLLSYDPIGRYKTKEQFELFEKTFWYFYNNIERIELSIILTKRSINTMINNKKDKFINTDINIPISLNYCIPDSVLKEELPSDDDLFNFYKWCLDNNLFQIIPIPEIIDVIFFTKNKDQIYVSDNNIIMYNENFVSNKVLPLIVKGNAYVDTNLLKYFNNINERGCFICEHKDICIEPYYFYTYNISEDYNVNICYINRVIKYILGNPDIKDKYMEYNGSKKYNE
jgi:hypothetical protein